MKKKHTHSKNNNMQLVLLFLLFVFLLIVVSISIRFFTILQKSKFDGDHRFTVAVSYVNKTTPIDIISFDTGSKTVDSVRITKPVSINSISNFLEIPIDANVQFKSAQTKQLSYNDIKSLLQNIVFYHVPKTTLTIIDAARLWFFMNSEPNVVISTVAISPATSDLNKDKLVSPLFIDSAVVQDQKTIVVVNGTDTIGLGNRLSKFIDNIGGNVIEISNADTPVNNSSIAYYGNKTYTVDKMQKILNFPLYKLEKPGISDMIITIGEKQLTTIPF